VLAGQVEASVLLEVTVADDRAQGEDGFGAVQAPSRSSYVETALLMTRFYEFLNLDPDNTSAQPVRALREARTWLRHLTSHQAEQYVQGHPCLAQAITSRPSATDSSEPPYAEPQSWAAFTAWGY